MFERSEYERIGALRATLSEINEILEGCWQAHRPKTKPAVMKPGSFARSTSDIQSKTKSFSSWQAA